ncbi:aminoglycoside phosphotransferase [Plantactinospora sp. BC1]|uniref:phosphotransferase enzyme family protein n=1 Tax=Plantactinospora sp. BC1 TaxID=2108470 RepID=UPI000D173A02|nr:aminoglycoside phosphotransferase family protein [Plantactinospora sp. BC1]AVT32678.1 aminoglycoside phosphotransferase [Plantactinospora sp. BC1]
MSAHADPLQGRLGPARLKMIVAATCRETGLDPTDATLIKFTNNAVFRLPRESVVLRIAGSATMRNRVTKVLQVTNWLAKHNFPAVRPLKSIEQPLLIDGDVVTLWKQVPEGGPPANGRHLGEILKQLHHIADRPPMLPLWDPISSIRSRLDEAEILGAENYARLLDVSSEIESDLSGLAYDLPPGLIHGDATVANLITGNTHPILCDFDAASLGPREWDLTPVATGHLRFEPTGNNQSLIVEAYGFDITEWPGFSVLRRLRELQLVTSVLPVLQSNSSLQPQWQHRLRTFLGKDTGQRWHLYG